MSTLLPSWFAVIGHVAVHDVNSRYLILYNSELHPTFIALFIPLARTLLTSGSQIYIAIINVTNPVPLKGPRLRPPGQV